ncbi:helix-turn-helix protein [compost metagenome]
MLRQAIAAALKHVRQQQQVLLTDLEKGVDASHLNRIELAKRGVTIEKLHEIARQLGVHPLSILALAYGAEAAERPTDLLERISVEVTALGGSFSPLAIKPPSTMHPLAAAAAERRKEVQRLKAEGRSKAEVARLLGISKQTAARHW